MVVNVRRESALRPARSNRTGRVRDVLRDRILGGGYEDGLLPTEHELMLEYAESRGAVREALAMLRDEGMIERRQGSGTFVVLRKARHRFDHVHGIASPSTGRAVLGRVVSIERLAAPTSVADVLRIDSGAPCVHIEFHTIVGNTVFNTNASYLSGSAVPADLPLGTFHSDFYQYLEAHGMPVLSGELVVEAVNADAGSAAALGVAEGAALMLFRRLLFTTNNIPLEFGFVRCRGDQLALATRLPRRSEEVTWLTS